MDAAQQKAGMQNMKREFLKLLAGRAALCSALGALAGAASLLYAGSRRRLIRRRAKRGLRELSQLLGAAQRMLGSI